MSDVVHPEREQDQTRRSDASYSADQTSRAVHRLLLTWLRWWLRWWAVYFTPLAWQRLRKCRHGHPGPFYDGGVVCLTCCAPWFGKREYWQTRAAQR